MRPVHMVAGMAGSGKSTLVALLQRHMKDAFVVNADPAVLEPPYAPAVDIRQAVDYDALVTERRLGPNGAILAALGLFAAQAPRLPALAPPGAPVLFDAPGQIEAFAWSASGEVLLRAFPGTALLYVADGARCADPAAFVSSMLYMLAVLHRLRMGPGEVVVVLNKADLLDGAAVPDGLRAAYRDCFGEQPADLRQVLLGYARDALFLADAFAAAPDGALQGHLADAALQLRPFWEGCRFVAVSAARGDGVDELLAAMGDAAAAAAGRWQAERAAKEKAERERVEEQQARLDADLDQND